MNEWRYNEWKNCECMQELLAWPRATLPEPFDFIFCNGITPFLLSFSLLLLLPLLLRRNICSCVLLWIIGFIHIVHQKIIVRINPIIQIFTDRAPTTGPKRKILRLIVLFKFFVWLRKVAKLIHVAGTGLGGSSFVKCRWIDGSIMRVCQCCWNWKKRGQWRRGTWITSVVVVAINVHHV